MNPLIQLQKAAPVFVVMLVCVGLLPRAQAVSPPPPGGYPNFTTAAGDHALQALTSGLGNTALGTFSLFSVATGSFNTAVGAGSLDLNTADSNTATGAAALLFNTTGTENTANGTAALESNDTGSQNTGTGAFALFSNTGGSFNTAIGVQALFSNTGSANTGSANTATGYQALFENTTGNENTASGDAALALNNAGSFNTAHGAQALNSNTTGSNNTATGFQALNRNISANFNTADGYQALFSNTEGIANTATGFQALHDNNSGNNNTASGYLALLSNTTGMENTAVGFNALLQNTTGVSNTAIGSSALAKSTGNFNIAIGRFAGLNVATADNVICIGLAGADVSDSCFIGKIRGTTTQQNDAIPVVVDTAGQLGTVSSSRRFKKQIKLMDKTSEAILALKPVTFSYKSDSTNRLEFGLIAEDVAQVNPDLVVRDEKGEIYTVRYDAVNAMLLNEFLKEHGKVEQLTEDFRSKLSQQQKQIEALTAGLEKVSAKLATASPSRGGLEASKRAPQVVLNNQ